jgi:outer membrane protein TolC
VLLFATAFLVGCTSPDEKAYPTSLSSINAEEAAGNLTRRTTIEEVMATSPMASRNTSPDAGKMPPVSNFKVREENGRKIVSLALLDFVRLAEANDVEFMRLKESLASSEESLRASLRAYRPVFGGSISSSYDLENSIESQNISFSLSQELPWNGGLNINTNAARGHTGSPTTESMSLTSALSLSFDIALRPGGYATWRESLIGAERAWVYAQRSFRSSRESYLIGKVREFYNVINSQKSLINQQKRLDDVQKNLDLTLFNYNRGNSTLTDVYTARQNLIDTQQAIVDGQQSYEEQMDELKLSLDIPQEYDLELIETPVMVPAIVVDVEETIKLALAHNPAYQTQRDQYEDRRRSFMLSLYALRIVPHISFSYNLPLVGESTEADPNTNSDWSATINWSYNLDQESRKKQYRSLLQSWWVYERDFKRTQEENIKNIRRRVRNFENTKRTLTIAERSYNTAKLGKEGADLEYENGKIDTTKYNVSINTLRSAEDSLNSARVGFKIAYYEYLSLIGQLKFDEEGEWLK